MVSPKGQVFKNSIGTAARDLREIRSFGWIWFVIDKFWKPIADDDPVINNFIFQQCFRIMWMKYNTYIHNIFVFNQNIRNKKSNDWNILNFCGMYISFWPTSTRLAVYICFNCWVDFANLQKCCIRLYCIDLSKGNIV